MPTAVLMRIGQIDVMKITNIAEGWLSRNAASAIGSQASGGTVRRIWKIGSSPRIAQTDWPMSAPSRTPTTAARPKPIATRWSETSTRQPSPMSWRAEIEERRHDQVARLAPDHRRRGQRRARPVAQDLPEQQEHRGHDQRRQDAAEEPASDGKKPFGHALARSCERDDFRGCGWTCDADGLAMDGPGPFLTCGIKSSASVFTTANPIALSTMFRT